MPKPFQPQVVTAQDLVEGDSLFLGPEGWTARIAEARVAATPEEAEALEAEARKGETANHVLGVYMVPVRLAGGSPWPVARREQIRAQRAPTIPVGPDAAPQPRAAA